MERGDCRAEGDATFLVSEQCGSPRFLGPENARQALDVVHLAGTQFRVALPG